MFTATNLIIAAWGIFVVCQLAALIRIGYAIVANLEQIGHGVGLTNSGVRALPYEFEQRAKRREGKTEGPNRE